MPPFSFLADENFLKTGMTFNEQEFAGASSTWYSSRQKSVITHACNLTSAKHTSGKLVLSSRKLETNTDLFLSYLCQSATRALHGPEVTAMVRPVLHSHGRTYSETCYTRIV